MQTIDYKAIARRFRPKRFKEVTGQDPIVKTLMRAVKEKIASHAYLFTGIRGTGKTTLARLFAKALNCTNPSPEGEPCNECSSCQDIMKGKSLDVIEIDGASNRGIDDIRSLNEALSYIPIQSYFKIFIIDEVHMLTKEAFNALLKSLEEPPTNVKFFLATTEVHKVLPTIVSRCQRFDLARILPGLIIQKLRAIAKEIEVAVEDEALSLIARLSEGSLRDAESLLDQLICLGQFPITGETIRNALGLIERSEYFAFDEAYDKKDLSYAFTFAQKVFFSGKDMNYFLETILDHYRNIALLFLGQLDLNSSYFLEGEQEGYKRALSIYSQNEILRIIDFLSEHIYQTMRPSYKKIFIEMLLLKILQEKNKVTVDQIVAWIDSGDIEKIFIEKEEVPRVELKTLEPVLEQKPAPEPKKEESINQTLAYETRLRFAQVELGGSLKKNL